ncbi:MAG: hypothetical protein ACLFSQ_09495 [Candidatus Zixiibacteriota bacterium]
MKAFVGIDVSKKWLDMALWVDGEIVKQLSSKPAKQARVEATRVE